MTFTRTIICSFFSLYWTGLLAQTASPGITWQLPIGGSGNDEVRTMAYTPDGGIIVAGYTASDDLGGNESYGVADYWIVKFDANHNIQWESVIGGSQKRLGSEYH